MTTVNVFTDTSTNELILDIQHRLKPNSFNRQDVTNLITHKIVDAVVDDFLANNALEIIGHLDAKVIAQLATTKAILKAMEKLDNVHRKINST